MTRFWFPYEDSLLYIVILCVSDLIQDAFVMEYVIRKTGCTYSFFFGRTIFSWANFALVWNLAALTGLSSLFAHLAYAFEQEKVGIFAFENSSHNAG